LLRSCHIAATLLVAAACLGCSSHDNAAHWTRGGAAAQQVIYSPNGEPLSGGPLGRPTCRDALSSWFSRVDADHDGVVDHDEFMSDARVQFDRMDLGHDGFITSAKLSVFRAPYEVETPGTIATDSKSPGSDSAQDGGSEQRQRRDQSSGGSQGNSGTRSQGQGQQQRSDGSDPVMSADRSLTFKVTLPDFLANAEEVFSRLDNAHTGKLSLTQVQSSCAGKR
jgi:hypothetical protein